MRPEPRRGIKQEMNVAPWLLLALGLAMAAFGWWGLYTEAGNRRFDEMAGMIPFSVGCAGGLFAVVGLVWLGVRLLRDAG